MLTILWDKLKSLSSRFISLSYILRVFARESGCSQQHGALTSIDRAGGLEPDVHISSPASPFRSENTNLAGDPNSYRFLQL